MYHIALSTEDLNLLMLRMYRKEISILSIISFTIFLMLLNIVSSSFGSELVQKTTGQSDVQKDYSFIIKWGSYGSGDGQFVDPEHLTVDSEGNVYVSIDITITFKFLHQ